MVCTPFVYYIFAWHLHTICIVCSYCMPFSYVQFAIFRDCKPHNSSKTCSNHRIGEVRFSTLDKKKILYLRHFRIFQVLFKIYNHMSAWRCPKGFWLKVRARKVPRLLLFHISDMKYFRFVTWNARMTQSPIWNILRSALKMVGLFLNRLQSNLLHWFYNHE